MKFVSKSSNMMIVLSPGVPGSTITGQAAKHGLYVRFKDGMVEVKEQSVIEKLRNHPSFNIDFVEVPENAVGAAVDPYADSRDETEPGHVMTEIKYGHVEKVTGSPRKVKISPELKKYIAAEAQKLARSMVKDMIPEILKEAKKSVDAEKKTETPVNTEKESE